MGKSVISELNTSNVNQLIPKGNWNATTNVPTLTSSTGNEGEFYIVSVSGTTNLNGITDWQVGDWALFTGGVWVKSAPPGQWASNGSKITPFNDEYVNVGSGKKFTINDVNIKDISETLTNKTIDLDNNTISNIEVDNFKSGAIESTITDDDTKLPTSGAVVDYAEPKDATILKEADIIDALNSTSATNPLSAKQGKALKDIQDTLAIDSAVVHKTGAETIAGAKKFSDDMEIASANAFYFGDKDTDGSWRLIRNGTSLEVQLRVATVWTQKHEFTV